MLSRTFCYFALTFDRWTPLVAATLARAGESVCIDSWARVLVSSCLRTVTTLG